MIVGITGTNGSGKGSVAKILKERGFKYYSLSDFLREVLHSRGEEENIPNLIKLANELRTQHGHGYLSEKILERIKKDKAGNAIVDSIRNPAEVEVLRNEGDFVMIAVDAPIELRYKRVSEGRGRAGDDTSFEEFKRNEDVQLKSDNPASQQLIKVFEMADNKIINDGTKEDLKKKVNSLLEEIKNG